MCSGNVKTKLRDNLLLGSLFSLAVLTYDLFALILYLIGYELLFKKSFWKIAISVVLAIAIYATFEFLTIHLDTILHPPFL